MYNKNLNGLFVGKSLLEYGLGFGNIYSQFWVSLYVCFPLSIDILGWFIIIEPDMNVTIILSSWKQSSSQTKENLASLSLGHDTNIIIEKPMKKHRNMYSKVNQLKPTSEFSLPTSTGSGQRKFKSIDISQIIFIFRLVFAKNWFLYSTLIWIM